MADGLGILEGHRHGGAEPLAQAVAQRSIAGDAHRDLDVFLTRCRRALGDADTVMEAGGVATARLLAG